MRVNGLPMDATEEDIQEIFKAFGRRDIIAIIRDENKKDVEAQGSENGQTVSAIVGLDSPHDAQTAEAAINNSKRTRSRNLSASLQNIFDIGEQSASILIKSFLLLLISIMLFSYSILFFLFKDDIFFSSINSFMFPCDYEFQITDSLILRFLFQFTFFR